MRCQTRCVAHQPRPVACRRAVRAERGGDGTRGLHRLERRHGLAGGGVAHACGVAGEQEEFTVGAERDREGAPVVEATLATGKIGSDDRRGRLGGAQVDVHVVAGWPVLASHTRTSLELAVTVAIRLLSGLKAASSMPPYSIRRGESGRPVVASQRHELEK